MATERASSEVLYSTVNSAGPTPSSGVMGPSSFARSRRSLAEPPNNSSSNNSSNIYEDIDQFHSQPPMITPVSGVPNLKGKAVIRPIAFRPTPASGGGMLSGASTPTNPPSTPSAAVGFRPINAGTPVSGGGGGPGAALPPSGNGPRSAASSNATTPISGLYARINGGYSHHHHHNGGPVVVGGPQAGNNNAAVGVNGEGFAPGHPLIKDGRRHYGSSQELHVSQSGIAPGVNGVPSSFNKFNSLDRRALARRHHQHQQQQQQQQQHGINLSLAPSGAESLPPQYCAPPAVNISISNNNANNSLGHISAPSPAVSVASNGSRREPERRHSIYDRRHRINSNNSNNNNNGDSRLSAMNINGLPDPENNNGGSSNNTGNNNNNSGGSSQQQHSSGRTSGPASLVASILGKSRNYVQKAASSVYSSQESLHGGHRLRSSQQPQRSSFHHSRSSTTVTIGAGNGGVQVRNNNNNGAGSVNMHRSVSGSSINHVGGGDHHHHHHHGQHFHPNQHQRMLDSSNSHTSTSSSGSSGPTSCSSSSGTTSGVSSSNGSSHNHHVSHHHHSIGAPGDMMSTSLTALPSSSSGVSLAHAQNSSSSVTTLTPSPSDSAVCDLESMLKEKDSEIVYLRETMEQNEQVIFKVYEEKEKMWERELRKIKGLYDNRLRASQQKSAKMEQALTNQTYQLQGDKRRLEQEVESLRREAQERTKEQQQLKQELEELRQKLGGDKQSDWKHSSSSSSETAADGSSDKSLSESRVEVRELRMELERRESELEEARMARRALQAEVERLKRRNRKLGPASSDEGAGSSVDDEEDSDDEEEEDEEEEELAAQKAIIIARDREIEKLQSELDLTRQKFRQVKEEGDKFREGFETEKAHWLEEKEKVIRYQKQLQLNYVQMYRRNKTLEGELDEINRTVEKQARTIEEKTKKQEEAEAAAAKASSSSSSKPKKSGGVRAKLFKMSLHSESQC